MTQSNDKSTPDGASFEAALQALEQIVHDLEEGRLGLAESLARYEEGVKLLKQCFQLLEHAERRIELLTGVDAAGNPVTKAFDATATLAPEESGSSRTSRRRKAPPAAEPAPPMAGMDEPGSLF